MCGVLLIAGSGARPPSVSDAVAIAMRDRLHRRGPDGAGLLRDGPVLLAHRRLAVVSPHDNPQPLVVGEPGDPRRVMIAFNGELYDRDLLRAELLRAGGRPTRNTDTELFALAIATWGEEAFARVRGMFAVVAWRPARRELLLARDALGVIPLYWALVDCAQGRELVAASEPAPILAHPAFSIRPDWSSVANYLITLRTECGGRTMFEGVRSLEPGTLLRCRLDEDEPRIESARWWRPERSEPDLDETETTLLVRETISASVRAHLAADVPVAALLSGGLDSSIIVASALEAGHRLPTFCAGAAGERDSDLDAARRVAEVFGLPHRTTMIDADRFAETWPRLIETLGLPLSTPNEIAIHALGESIRPFAPVALSGEGADELFAGYGPALVESERWIAEGAEPVEAWHARTFAWVSPDLLALVLQPEVARRATPGAALEELRTCFESQDPRSLRTHLDAQRRLNLSSLLRRLNVGLMTASVEGRTPFADARVAELALRLPMRLLYADREERGGGASVLTLPGTKHILRRAFADLLPAEALARPKASFPLPFESWLAPLAGSLDTSSSARAVFAPAARALVREDPAAQWRLAWPILNVALWLRCWWD